MLEGADSTAAEALAKTIVALPVDALLPHTQRNFVGLATTKWSELDPAAAAAFMDTVPELCRYRGTCYRVAPARYP